MMGEIYSQAGKVLVWMGDEDQIIPWVFAFLRTMTIFDEDMLREQASLQLLQEVISRIIDSGSTTAIELFFHRPLFRRRWVLQELGLSQEAKIYYHDQQTSWESLAAAFRKFKIFRRVYEELFPFDNKAQNALAMANLLNGA
jgi:hypothetical protein